MSENPNPEPRIAFAASLRHCLNRLLADTLDHDLKVAALHLKIAIVELDDFLDNQGLHQAADHRHDGNRPAA
ncbi:MAG: hypothetical protein Tsb0016_00700 [Sphingomonadales bacterium]